MVGKCTGMLEYMLEPLPVIIDSQSAGELIPITRGIVHPTATTCDTVRFLRTIGIKSTLPFDQA